MKIALVVTAIAGLALAGAAQPALAIGTWDSAPKGSNTVVLAKSSTWDAPSLGRSWA